MINQSCFFQLCSQLQVDALIITGTDPHQLEYPLSKFKFRHLLSKFEGSAGTLIIYNNGKYTQTGLWTDGRYETQAKLSIIPPMQFFISKEDDWNAQLDWIVSNHSFNSTEHTPLPKHSISIGICDLQFSQSNVELLQMLIQEHKSDLTLSLKVVPYNKIATIVLEELPDAKTYLFHPPDQHPLLSTNPKYKPLLHNVWNLDTIQQSFPISINKSTDSDFKKIIKERLSRFSTWLKDNNIHMYISANLNEIAWLLNLRSITMNYLMVFPCVFGLHTNTNTIILWLPSYLQNEKSVKQIKAFQFSLDLEIIIKNYDEIIENTQTFFDTIQHLTQGSKSIALDTQNIPHAFYHSSYITIHSPITLWKSVRTELEIEHTKYTYRQDNIALLEAMADIEELLQKGHSLTEQEAALIILSHRQNQDHFMQLSFNTILASGANAALPHYNTASKPSKIDKDNLFLVDSGAHYLYGTTDLTRVFYFGNTNNIPQLLKEDASYVLKAHIALANYKIRYESIMPQEAPIYPTGEQLDLIGRAILAYSGRVFKHGTGHGIGYCTDVHEGVQRIGAHVKQQILPNMIMSNEPGFYRPKKWGVRIENSILSALNSEKEYYFETLSFFPIQLSLFDLDLLSKRERSWLHTYHNTCLENLNSSLSPKATRFLKTQIT